MKKSTIAILLLACGAFANATVILDDIGAPCGGMGQGAPQPVDNCWSGYLCNPEKSLICVRNSQWYWGCETKGSIGPDGKPVNESQCKPTEEPKGRKLIADTEVVTAPAPLVVPEFGSCGGTGSQVPKDRLPVDSCWENTKCAAGTICIKEDAYGYFYQCLKPGSKNYKGEQVFVDACKH